MRITDVDIEINCSHRDTEGTEIYYCPFVKNFSLWEININLK